MPSNVPLPDYARALVQKVARDYGYLGKDSSRSTPANSLRPGEDSRKKKAAVRKALVKLVKCPEQGVNYFVFELLRNADDSNFTRARTRNENPFVTFRISPSLITIECNDDGFTQGNLDAIYQQYFGPEGIEFKSVFAVAYKVHVQSESFSFSFNHRRGQSGMGMISPTWEDSNDIPKCGITRIKLFLHSSWTDNAMLRQFEKLQETHLLFLRNIRCVDIIHITDKDVIISSKRLLVRKNTSNLITLANEQDHASAVVGNYFVHKYPVPHLPRSRGIVFSVGGTPREGLPPSEIVLAFPLDEAESDPIINPQQAFTFFPIRKTSFKFLIQADFAVRADHRDIDPTSNRNQILLDVISTAFQEAILELCKISTLRYKWMRYLPQNHDHHDHPDGYWKNLYDLIRVKIQATPPMQCLGKDSLYKTERIKRFKPTGIDNEEKPIFRDSFPRKYLSNRYKDADLKYLSDGMSGLAPNDIINELRLQSGASPDVDLIRILYEALANLLPKSEFPDQGQSLFSRGSYKATRQTFEAEALIFAAGAWYTTKACIWSSKTTMTDKVNLSQHYHPSMKKLFVNMLGVPEPNANTALEELRIKSAADTTMIRELKKDLWQFNSHLSTTTLFYTPKTMILDDIKLPIRYPDGSVKLLSATSSDFVVVDRKRFGERFNGIATMLDFTLDEVICLRPFLRRAGLDKFYLSVRAKEDMTIVWDADPGAQTAQEPLRNIRLRAYSLCRIASHFRSRRAESAWEFYQILKKVKVEEAFSLKSELSLFENGRCLNVGPQEVRLHFDCKDDVPKIVVPSDASQRNQAFLYDLPQALFEWIMVDTQSPIGSREIGVAKRLITVVLNSEPASLGSLLDGEGIEGLDFPEDGERPVEPQSLKKKSRPTAEFSPTSKSKYLSPNPDFRRKEYLHSQDMPVDYSSRRCNYSPGLKRPTTPITSVDDDDTVGGETPLSSVFSPSPNWTQQEDIDQASPITPWSETYKSRIPRKDVSPSPLSRKLPQRPKPTPIQSTQLGSPEEKPKHKPNGELGDKGNGSPSKEPTYKDALQTVIDASRGRGLKGMMKCSLEEAAGDNSDNGYFSHKVSKSERARKMGAAGELYVFELLLTLELPRFSGDSWKSDIKELVSEHDDYKDIGNYGAGEADIMYTDMEGVLTTAFIKNGYLDEAVWDGKKPRYFIEVKATKDGLGVPFSVTKQQRDSMKRMKNFKDHEGIDAIYVIFRVYYIDGPGINHCIYVNPWQLVEDGHLCISKPSKKGTSVIIPNDVSTDINSR
ncbi:putative ino80 chromatin remodeling complex protein [Rosellinia necatrix]|uniref:Putative ino80 chromatin remodeling complex protein n=1 Tax=Rosellinia necatrix TaxID=77044 RepID=A0A1W2TPT7_ROSNE|nr:putative ino80 chromatin remodeling complex protein [Rosellinia necatrix]